MFEAVFDCLMVLVLFQFALHLLVLMQLSGEKKTIGTF